ncbi:MAG TPA: precorrin-6y C5,15-methyltransferase (decarboxylating) subunit CbiE [Candidatus Avacidaminococcus intestinavium]|uniref:Precorrin-6y C5,15-methyltransferase (Decarboxylating) subunit CbiE n=1 Tax=Candidatus Avacidaminococcus intestinavium TaxID=2840684 RepID=A0A9D1MR92_9FIRM|nr:precorrin-6y C5,15-methyltransferase (decarboxylating) subunit CbiE [Candidatus Avacidaminococcus intestinavium]
MRRVNIVGIGPGNPQLLTKAADEVIKQSKILIGDSRMIAFYEDTVKKTFTTISPIEINNILKTLPGNDEASILVSGDVGFFSLAATLSGKLTDCEVIRYPGISSLVYFAALLNMSWQDAQLVSMHGRENNLIAQVAAHAKVFALTGGHNSPNALCQKLSERGLGKVVVYVGEKLSYPEERVVCGTAEEIAMQKFDSLSVMMILNSKPQKKQGIHGLPDESFVRAKVPMTKQEVRSVALSKLTPKATDIIYDIGAGTGSVSIELALLSPLGAVYAFERNEEAIKLLEINRERFGVDNLNIIKGEASQALSEAPVPDCVFIGGSGGKLEVMLDDIYAKNSRAKIVVTAITIETLAQTMQYYATKKDYLTEVVNVFVARSQKAGPYNLMKAQNPVYVITIIKKDEML